MCGINGIFVREVSFSVIEKGAEMNQLIRHRGPDDNGGVAFLDGKSFPIGYQDSVSKDESVSYLNFQSSLDYSSATSWLGHRRLSILDLSPLGHCPMSSLNDRYWITYNGEIYNYLEIRAELLELGVVFKTNTDTEVVLQAYIYWGEKCVDQFNGMWAFVIFDNDNQTLFGSRDRFGVKPFYYSLTDKVFSFSSEQKALVESGVVAKKVNKKAVYDFLAFTQIEHEKESFFQGVIELLPGFSFSFSLQKWELQSYRYYHLQTENEIEEIDASKEKFFIEEVQELFKRSIDLRLRSDVKVGACLSGGIDSSAIVGQMAFNGQEAIHTFTGSSHEKELDETHFSDLVVQKYGAFSKVVTPTSNELLADFEELIYCQDIPLFSSSTYAQWRVLKMAKEEGVKVVLDGQGGDELFAGYLPYHLNLWMDLLKNGQFSRLKKELSGYGSLQTGVQFFIKQYLRFYGLKKLPNSLFKALLQKFYSEHQYIQEDLKSTFSGDSFRNYQSNLPTSLNGMLKYEFDNTRLKSYLKCEDRCSMWHSVEARTPFADDLPLIEKVFSIPGNYKIKKGVKKFLLREATKQVLPEEIYNRKDKMGYVTPNNLWIKQIKSELKEYFTSDLEEYFNMEQLLADYDQFFDQTHMEENQSMFKFIAFAIWKKKYKM